MRLVFSGLEHPIEIENGSIAVLEVANRSLFARICQSIRYGAEGDAPEPYSLWDDQGLRLRAANTVLYVGDPLDLPWKERPLVNGLYDFMRTNIYEDEELRHEISELGVALHSAIAETAYQMHGEYGFALEWDVRAYLKSFGFGICLQESGSLLDNLIQFLEYVDDVCRDALLVFCNLKLFLTEKDISDLYESVFFHGSKMLLLECSADCRYLAGEKKIVVDQGFLEYDSSFQSGDLSSSQGGFCTNGFGAVTF